MSVAEFTPNHAIVLIHQSKIHIHQIYIAVKTNSNAITELTGKTEITQL